MVPRMVRMALVSRDITSGQQIFCRLYQTKSLLPSGSTAHKCCQNAATSSAMYVLLDSRYLLASVMIIRRLVVWNRRPSFPWSVPIHSLYKTNDHIGAMRLSSRQWIGHLQELCRQSQLIERLRGPVTACNARSPISSSGTDLSHDTGGLAWPGVIALLNCLMRQDWLMSLMQSCNKRPTAHWFIYVCPDSLTCGNAGPSACPAQAHFLLSGAAHLEIQC